MTAEREAMTERQAFEKWLDAKLSPFTTTAQVKFAWEGWQAAIANLSRAAEPVAWEFQHEETGLMTQVSNNGIDNIENFTANNPRWQYIGPLYLHPPEPARDAKCKWAQDVDGNWGTDCGNLHILINGTPHDNEMGFCCYCGHAIDQVLYHDAAMAQESGE